MIGFGKTLFSFRRGETEYGFKAIPLGGYISMIGMFPPGKAGGAAATPPPASCRRWRRMRGRPARRRVAVGEEDRTFYRLPVWKRIVIMFGGPFMNLLIGVVLFGVLLMGFGTPQSSTTVGTGQPVRAPRDEHAARPAPRMRPSRSGRRSRAEAGRHDRQHRRHEDHLVGAVHRDHPAVRRPPAHRRAQP